MTIASIDKIFTQGSLQTTGFNLDLAIQGDGFFITKRGEERFYTRAGSFGLDKNGLVVNPANGFRVQGWNAVKTGTEYVINTSGDLEDVVIPVGGKDPAKATEAIKYKSNLDAETPLLPIGREPTPEELIKGTGPAAKYWALADRRIFAVMAFLNAVGYDEEAPNARMTPLRLKVREKVASRLSSHRQKLREWRRYYDARRRASWQYANFALAFSTAARSGGHIPLLDTLFCRHRGY